jgi:CO/xanthine dehydrogenase FAD-binding subunit
MKEVFLPRTLDEVWEILAKEPQVAVYAGGSDLLVKIRASALNPPCLMCLERVAELQGVRDDGKEIFIAAATTHSRLLEEPHVREHFPVLTKALSVLGSPPVRHMGTIGGNIVTASPAGDSLPPLYALDADVMIQSAEGQSRFALKEFILGPGTVDLHPGEILGGVVIRKQLRFNVHHYEKVGRRKAQACAIASMAALLDVSEDGTIRDARLAWGSVGPTVVVAPDVERRLIGAPLSVDTLKEVSHLVESAVSPIDDIRASADYRRAVAGAMLLRLSTVVCNGTVCGCHR